MLLEEKQRILWLSAQESPDKFPKTLNDVKEELSPEELKTIYFNYSDSGILQDTLLHMIVRHAPEHVGLVWQAFPGSPDERFELLSAKICPNTSSLSQSGLLDLAYESDKEVTLTAVTSLLHSALYKAICDDRTDEIAYILNEVSLLKSTKDAVDVLASEYTAKHGAFFKDNSLTLAIRKSPKTVSLLIDLAEQWPNADKAKFLGFVLQTGGGKATTTALIDAITWKQTENALSIYKAICKLQENEKNKILKKKYNLMLNGSHGSETSSMTTKEIAEKYGCIELDKKMKKDLSTCHRGSCSVM